MPKFKYNITDDKINNIILSNFVIIYYIVLDKSSKTRLRLTKSWPWSCFAHSDKFFNSLDTYLY